jgi:lysozyme family protein
VTPRFLDAFAKTVGHEGGLSKDPNDPGNWTGGRVGAGQLKGTKFGISAKAYPLVDIDSLTLGEAQIIYLRDYWQRLNCDSMPAPVDALLFDAAVNHGPANAVRILQRALEVADDGDFGPITTAALEHARHEPAKLVGRFIAHRLLFWASLSIFDSQGRGWTRRGARELLDALEEV